MNLEQLLCSSDGFELPLSPLQRAIAQAADGLPIADEIDDALLEAHFGCPRSQIGLTLPTVVALIAGVRSGKSVFAAAAALKGATTADLSPLLRHEIARAVIVAPTVDNATATFRLLLGALQGSKSLSKLIVGEPTADTVLLRRPDKRLVEICVVAAHRGGITLRSRWLLAVVLEEVALFGTETTGAVVNAEELLRAAETRLLKGGQIWLVSSPFGPQGLLWDLWRLHYGKPGRNLVVKAPTMAMNTAFDPEQVEAVRARNADAASREYDAEFIDADAAYLDGLVIERQTRTEPRELPPRRAWYSAAIDAGARGNAWTFVVLQITQGDDGRPLYKVAVARQWRGHRFAPLSPAVVFSEIGRILEPYGVTRVLQDQFSADAHVVIARRENIELVTVPFTASNKLALYEQMKALLTTGALELAPVPELVSDLRSIRKRATANAITIELPKTSDGRHADFVPALVLACTSGGVAQAAAARRRALDEQIAGMLPAGGDGRATYRGPVWGAHREFEKLHGPQSKRWVPVA